MKGRHETPRITRPITNRYLCGQVLVPRLRNGGVQVPALGSSLCSGINKPLVQVGGMEVTELWVLSIAWNQGSVLGGFSFVFFFNL